MENFSKYFGVLLKVVPLYGFTCATLYTFGYWFVFRINIFEYLGFGQLLITTMPVMLTVILMGLFSVAIDQCLWWVRSKFGESRISSSESASSGWLRIVTLGFVLSFVIGLCVYTIATDDSARFLFAGMIFAIPVSIIGVRTQFLSALLSNFSLKPHVLVILVFPITCFFGIGYSQAFFIKEGSNYMSISGKPNTLRYIGIAGDRYFFFDPETSLVHIADSGEYPVLKLKQTVKKAGLY